MKQSKNKLKSYLITESHSWLFELFSYFINILHIYYLLYQSVFNQRKRNNKIIYWKVFHRDWLTQCWRLTKQIQIPKSKLSERKGPKHPGISQGYGCQAETFVHWQSGDDLEQAEIPWTGSKTTVYRWNSSILLLKCSNGLL